MDSLCSTSTDAVLSRSVGEDKLVDSQFTFCPDDFGMRREEFQYMYNFERQMSGRPSHPTSSKRHVNKGTQTDMTLSHVNRPELSPPRKRPEQSSSLTAFLANVVADCEVRPVSSPVLRRRNEEPVTPCHSTGLRTAKENFAPTCDREIAVTPQKKWHSAVSSAPFSSKPDELVAYRPYRVPFGPSPSLDTPFSTIRSSPFALPSTGLSRLTGPSPLLLPSPQTRDSLCVSDFSSASLALDVSPLLAYCKLQRGLTRSDPATDAVEAFVQRSCEGPFISSCIQSLSRIPERYCKAQGMRDVSVDKDGSASFWFKVAKSKRLERRGLTPMTSIPPVRKEFHQDSILSFSSGSEEDAPPYDTPITPISYSMRHDSEPSWTLHRFTVRNNEAIVEEWGLRHGSVPVVVQAATFACDSLPSRHARRRSFLVDAVELMCERIALKCLKVLSQDFMCVLLGSPGRDTTVLLANNAAMGGWTVQEVHICHNSLTQVEADENLKNYSTLPFTVFGKATRTGPTSTILRVDEAYPHLPEAHNYTVHIVLNDRTLELPLHLVLQGSEPRADGETSYQAKSRVEPHSSDIAGYPRILPVEGRREESRRQLPAYTVVRCWKQQNRKNSFNRCMSPLKYLKSSGILAWCPSIWEVNGQPQPLLAVGEKTIGTAKLLLLTYDAADDCTDLQRVAEVPTPDGAPFSCLLWDNATKIFPGSQLGSIVAGMENGSIIIWDADSLLHGGKPQHAVFESRYWNEDEQGAPDAITSLALGILHRQDSSCVGLTAGTSAGGIRMAMFYPGQRPVLEKLKSRSPAGGPVTDLTFGQNPNLKDILVAAVRDGGIQLWNSANGKCAMAFVDRNRSARGSWPAKVCFFPKDPFKFVVAYDDASPVLQVWDVRQKDYPIREIATGHTRGILDLQFSPDDENLLASVGKDHKIIFWVLSNDTPTQIAEILTPQPEQQLRWSTAPGVVAVASAQEGISVYSLASHAKYTRLAPGQKRYCPKWLRRPAGVCMGFGGRFIYFNSHSTKINCEVVLTEKISADRADAFEQAISTSDWKAYCESCISSASDNEERLTWSVVSSTLGSVNDRRTVLMEALGLNPEQLREKAENILGCDPTSLLESLGTPEKQFVNRVGSLSLDNEEMTQKFFSELRGDFDAAPEEAEESTGIVASDGLNWFQGKEGFLNMVLSAGNHRLAAAVALHLDRHAEALLIAANSHDADLWRETQQAYLRKFVGTGGQFGKLLSGVANDDLAGFVAEADLNYWKDALGVLITYALPGGPASLPSASNALFSQLATQLSVRLEQEKADPRTAVVCLVAAGDFENTVRIWSTTPSRGTNPTQALQCLVEKTIALKESTKNPVEPTGDLADRIIHYATILANSGRLVAAMRYLSFVPSATAGTELRNRIWNSNPGAMRQAGIPAPDNRFNPERANPTKAPSAPQGQVGAVPFQVGPFGQAPQFPAAPYGMQPLGQSAPKSFPPPPPQPNLFTPPVPQNQFAPNAAVFSPTQPQFPPPPPQFGSATPAQQQFGSATPAQQQFGSATPAQQQFQPAKPMPPTPPMLSAPPPCPRPGFPAPTPKSYSQPGFQAPPAPPQPEYPSPPRLANGGGYSSSTAPYAGAMPAVGMPTPWPIPTGIQQAVSTASECSGVSQRSVHARRELIASRNKIA